MNLFHVISPSHSLMPRFHWKMLTILEILGQKLGNFGDDLGDIPNQLELKVDQVPEMQMRRDAAMTFVKYFVSKLTKVDDQQQKEGLESEAIKVLLRTQKGKLPNYVFKIWFPFHILYIHSR